MVKLYIKAKIENKMRILFENSIEGIPIELCNINSKQKCNFVEWII